MKRLALYLLPALLLAYSCKKKSDPPSYTCSTKPYVYADSSVLVLLATAFTPNGDGRNDVIGFSVRDTANASLTVTDKQDNEYYNSNGGRPSWSGLDKSGNNAPEGDYVAHVHFRTASGRTVDTIGCVHLFRYNGASCLSSASGYYFPDQLAPDGSTYPTGENLCQ